jgi:hypothetical protein
MEGYDIEVTQLESAFHVDTGSGRNLITRSLSRGVVASCFNSSKPSSNHSIVGNSGIGKSWTLVYALQQALLYENACVMFFFQKRTRALVCIRKDGKIYVWLAADDSLKNVCNSGLFENSNVLVLLDPAEKGALYTDGFRRFIFAASNNDVHFQLKPWKVTGAWRRILNPFSRNELIAALPSIVEMREIVNEVEIFKMLCRSNDVGNLPRYLVSQDQFEERKESRDTFIDFVKQNSKDLEAVLNWKGMSTLNNTFPGTVFAVSVDKTYFQGEHLLDVGYDGESVVNYNKIMVSLMVNQLKKVLMVQWRKSILSYANKYKAGLSTIMGIEVEDLFWLDIENKGKIK